MVFFKIPPVSLEFRKNYPGIDLMHEQGIQRREGCFN